MDSAQGGHTPPKIHLIARLYNFTNQKLYKRMIPSLRSGRFERRYRDNDGNWQSTHSYNVDDLLILAKLADQAHTEITKLRSGGAD